MDVQHRGTTLLPPFFLSFYREKGEEEENVNFHKHLTLQVQAPPFSSLLQQSHRHGNCSQVEPGKRRDVVVTMELDHLFAQGNPC